MTRKSANRNRPDDTRRPAFEFCVAGRPVSAQAKKTALLRKCKAQLAEAALSAWSAGQPPFTGDLELRVTQYSERRIADRDNLLKPIQDALQGICYSNDRQVKDSTSNWRHIDGVFGIRYMSMSLAIAFSVGAPFLHIRVFLSPDTEDLG